jgi:hypothetical protein
VASCAVLNTGLAELVEALLFFFQTAKEGKGFDRLSQAGKSIGKK